ncbi:MAG: glycine oxidase ThiO [Planctomycetota bacterium]|nr:glycine oxidase ThiO [Planctomycetota bacterium]
MTTDDCLIIGGGVIGLSLAYELSGRGLRVRVLDRGQPGRQTSWAGAGIFPPVGPRSAQAGPMEQLAVLSMQLHPVWAKQLLAESGIDNQFHQCGASHLAIDPASLENLQTNQQGWNAEQVTHQKVAAPEFAEFEPALHTAAGQLVAPAVYLSGETQLRNPRHLQALTAACKKRGVQIEQQVEVTGTSIQGGQIVKVETSAGDRSARQYCLTSGASSGGLASNFQCSLAVKPIRGQIVLLRNVAPMLRHVTYVGRHYFVPRQDGHVLVGSTLEDVGFRPYPTPAGVRDLLDFMMRVAPAWSDCEIETLWAGLRPGTADGLPYIGRVPGLENAFVATGHYRSGLYLSTGTALVMSRLLMNEMPLMDLHAFRLDREPHG